MGVAEQCPRHQQMRGAADGQELGQPLDHAKQNGFPDRHEAPTFPAGGGIMFREIRHTASDIMRNRLFVLVLAVSGVGGGSPMRSHTTCARP